MSIDDTNVEIDLAITKEKVDHIEKNYTPLERFKPVERIVNTIQDRVIWVFIGTLVVAATTIVINLIT